MDEPIRAIMRANIREVSKNLGPTSPALITMLDNIPAGAEDLFKVILLSMTNDGTFFALPSYLNFH